MTGGPLLRRLGIAMMCLTASAGLSLAAAPAASAHPLGNFSVNYFSGIRVEPEALEVELVVDRAEIPTLQAFPQARPGQQPAGAKSWTARECGALAGQAKLTVAGSPQVLTVRSTRLELLAGAAGLATSRLECTIRTSAAVDTVGKAVGYQAPLTDGRVGWHEVTARGDGVGLLGSTVSAQSTSRRLTAYPKDLLASPLDQRAADFRVRAGTGRVVGEELSGAQQSSPIYGLDRMTTEYTDLIARSSLTPGFAVVALLLSMVLGALHAFAPGHGKTLMAAYLVGREGTWRQAAVIGVSVTITHTVGVLLLGVALSVAAIAAPESVYPWLGTISGVLLVVIGVTLLYSARSGHTHGPGGHTHGPAGHTHSDSGHTHSEGGHTHSDSGHTHSEGGHTHSEGGHTHSDGGHAHGPAGHAHEPAVHAYTAAEDAGSGGAVTSVALQQSAPPGPQTGQQPHSHRRMLSTGRLAAVGLVGGLVPSPSALLVLLGGIALGRAWFGAVLVLAYGLGMAGSLVGTGLLLVAARDRLTRWGSGRADLRPVRGQKALLRWTGRLPVLTATTVILVGIWVAFRSSRGL